MKYKWLFLIVFFWSAMVSAQSSNPKAQKCFDDAFNQYNLGNEDKALKLLATAVKKDPKFSDAYSLQGLIYEGKKDSANALISYRNAISADPLAQVNYFTLAKYYFDLERYEDAVAILDQFDKVPNAEGFNPKKHGVRDRTKEGAARLRESCTMAIEDTKNMAGLNIQNMGPNINTGDYEYWPGMTIDGKIFIFTKNLDGQEDFYISYLNDSGWGKAIPLPGKINTIENEGTTSVSADGRFIFFTVCNQDGFGSCDLFYSAFNSKNNSWSKRMNLGENLNTAGWDAQPAISADGRTIIFASNRPGGYGGKDLWMSRFSNGKWSKPENLGNTINTTEDDEAPYLHYDGKTMYFSSMGHAGYGEHDLFISRKNTDGTWSKPINMGKGINTIGDEIGMYVDRKGSKAYFVSTRAGGFGGPDIYSFDLGKGKKPEAVSFVRGNVYDNVTKQEISGKIEIIDLNSNTVILTDVAPYFFTTLTPGGNYALNVYSDGYLFYSANFQPTVGSVDSPYIVDAYLLKLQTDVKTVLKNIFFDVDKFELKKESFTELENLLQLMQKNPTMKVEISGHTDNTGSEEHNKELSENRAKSVQQYLISKGIDANRLVAKGYGASQPIATNATEEGKALNRRIEMKIVAIK
ncbi:MAG: OmpA family protein [Bacteroidia bacterium]|nr:OmpA family protein [Bacteroidia bacterium]